MTRREAFEKLCDLRDMLEAGEPLDRDEVKWLTDRAEDGIDWSPEFDLDAMAAQYLTQHHAKEM